MKMRALTPCTVLRVIDGDTILCRLTCPCCRIVSEQRVRLARIDAPELKGAARGNALKVRDYLRDWLEGKFVKVAVRRSWPDCYGRVIAEMIADGINVSDHLLVFGHVKPWRETESGLAASTLPPLADAEDGEEWPR